LEATLGPSSYACASCAEVGPSRAKLLRLYEKLRFYTLFRAVPFGKEAKIIAPSEAVESLCAPSPKLR
jgi:hypothetical protein